MWAQEWPEEVYVHFWHLVLYKGTVICSVIKRHKEHSLFKGSILSIGESFCKAQLLAL